VRGAASLLRLTRYEADERQRALAALIEARAVMDQEALAFEAYAAAEAAEAALSPIAMMSYAAFVQRLNMERAAMIRRQAQADEDIAAAREALSEAFVEVKRIEMLVDKLARANAQRADRAEEDARDEAVLIRIARDGATR
jgi:flagellar protein FliJ